MVIQRGFLVALTTVLTGVLGACATGEVADPYGILNKPIDLRLHDDVLGPDRYLLTFVEQSEATRGVIEPEIRDKASSICGGRDVKIESMQENYLDTTSLDPNWIFDQHSGVVAPRDHLSLRAIFRCLGQAQSAEPRSETEALPDSMSQVRRIGVVSFIPEEITATGMYMSLLGGSSYKYTYAAESWESSRRIEQLIHSTIESDRRFTTVRLESDRELGERYTDKVFSWVGAGEPDLSQYLSPLTEGRDLDAVLVVYPFRAGRLAPKCPFTGTSAFVAGVYIPGSREIGCRGYGHTGLGVIDSNPESLLGTVRSGDKLEAYISLVFELRKADTFEKLDGVYVNEYQSIFDLGKPVSPEEFRASEQGHFKQEILYLLDTYIPAALYRMELLKPNLRAVADQASSTSASECPPPETHMVVDPALRSVLNKYYRKNPLHRAPNSANPDPEIEEFRSIWIIDRIGNDVLLGLAYHARRIHHGRAHVRVCGDAYEVVELTSDTSLALNVVELTEAPDDEACTPGSATAADTPEIRAAITEHYAAYPLYRVYGGRVTEILRIDWIRPLDSQATTLTVEIKYRYGRGVWDGKPTRSVAIVDVTCSAEPKVLDLVKWENWDG